MTESLVGFLFGFGALVLVGAALFYDDSAHMSHNPSHISE